MLPGFQCSLSALGVGSWLPGGNVVFNARSFASLECDLSTGRSVLFTDF
uniref:Uncharacterized protein n=1 Tax=Anguilla anguilla TaxID=7936 RepID=A0A0E9QL95_ANGAN